jgi:hypothetical protein
MKYLKIIFGSLMVAALLTVIAVPFLNFYWYYTHDFLPEVIRFGDFQKAWFENNSVVNQLVNGKSLDRKVYSIAIGPLVNQSKAFVWQWAPFIFVGLTVLSILTETKEKKAD